jgi:hypothetical protein
VLKCGSSEYALTGKCGTCRRKVSVLYAVIAMDGTVRNDPVCGCGRAIILYGQGTGYIYQRTEGNI